MAVPCIMGGWWQVAVGGCWWLEWRMAVAVKNEL